MALGFLLFISHTLGVKRLTEVLMAKTNLITQEGLDAIKAEIDHLWRVYRPEITEKVTWAASLGDRSENADYKENKRILRQIDSRVRFLRKRVDVLKVVPYGAEQEGRVFFGAWVTVEDDSGMERYFRIVGPDEIYGKRDHISIDSPMARACLGKEEDDEVVVRTAETEKVWYISQIKYK